MCVYACTYVCICIGIICVRVSEKCPAMYLAIDPAVCFLRRALCLSRNGSKEKPFGPEGESARGARRTRWRTCVRCVDTAFNRSTPEEPLDKPVALSLNDEIQYNRRRDHEVTRNAYVSHTYACVRYMCVYVCVCVWVCTYMYTRICIYDKRQRLPQ